MALSHRQDCCRTGVPKTLCPVMSILTEEGFMRRIATVGLAIGLAVLTFFAGSSAAQAATGFKTHGLTGVSAHGNYHKGKYHGKKTKVVEAYIKDTKKDGKSAAIRVKFTDHRYKADYWYMWNSHGKGTTARGAIQSYNLDHLYIKECLGHAKKGHFHPTKCGKYRKYY